MIKPSAPQHSSEHLQKNAGEPSQTVRESSKEEVSSKKSEEIIMETEENQQEWEDERVFSVFGYEDAVKSLKEEEWEDLFWDPKEPKKEEDISDPEKVEKPNLLMELGCDMEIQIIEDEESGSKKEEFSEENAAGKEEKTEPQEFVYQKDEKGIDMLRCAEVTRETGETAIELSLNLDGSGKAEVSTGIGFFDHMLNNFAKHGLFDLTVRGKGDLFVDCHHTIEDTGIVLGEAIKKALGDKKGIRRYGSMMLPMDEALILCALDLSGRPYLMYDVNLTVDRLGYFDTEMLREFFYALSYSAGMNIHIKQLSGSNNHHIVEGCFKAFAKALDEAVMLDTRITGVPSTKGVLN